MFQPQNAQRLETEFWTRDQDITGTKALFETPLVSNINLDMTHGAATPDDGEDPDRWFLLEWRDILMMGSPAVPSADAVPSTSWGFLKVLYLEP